MKILTRADFEVASERGSVIVAVVAIWLILMGVVAGLVIEIGHTAAHRRHLQVQTDAAALAAAQDFSLCSVNPSSAFPAMRADADKYGGFNGGTFNQQVGTASGYAGNITSAYQSLTYPGGTHAADPDSSIFSSGNTTQETCGDPNQPNPLRFFDVKATESNIHSVFNYVGIVSTTVNAHSRVELKAVNELSGLLPLGVPDVRPRYIFAKFIGESGTVTCTDQSNNPVPSCEEELTKGSVVGTQQQWVPAAPLQVTVPVGDVGVRIRLVGGTDPTAQCGTQYVECYDAANPAIGLIHIRGWDSAAASPVVKDASLINGNASCAPDVYFTTVDCNAGITADIDLGTINSSTSVWATVDGNGKYLLTTPTMSGNGVKTWSLASGIPITGGGPHVIALRFAINGSGNGTALGDVQRAYEAAPDSSGPLFLVQEYDSGANSTFGPYSYQGGTTHTLGVTVNTQGNLLLSAPSDPPIYLRVFNDNGNASQNQSINCDPAPSSNLETELANGCSPLYKTQTALTCPYANKAALFASPQPWTCAAIKTGASIGQVQHGLSERIFNGDQNPPNTTAECNTSPINWIKGVGFDENAHRDDKRVLGLFVTPLGSFTGTGSDVVPVLDFGYFYVTGYSGDPCEGNDPNQDPVPNNRGSYVRGHFIKFFPIDGHTTDDNCDLTTITPCTGVLTR